MLKLQVYLYNELLSPNREKTSSKGIDSRLRGARGLRGNRLEPVSRAAGVRWSLSRPRSVLQTKNKLTSYKVTVALIFGSCTAWGGASFTWAGTAGKPRLETPQCWHARSPSASEWWAAEDPRSTGTGERNTVKHTTHLFTTLADIRTTTDYTLLSYHKIMHILMDNSWVIVRVFKQNDVSKRKFIKETERY